MLRVNELTVDEFRDMLHEVVEEVLEEQIGLLTDPDSDLELRPEIARSLLDYLASDRRGDDADEVFRSLALGSYGL
jgi:hypothetical protein